MGSPRFYLHIGTAKSGTTYLQDVLFGSTEALAAQGAAMVPRRPGGHRNLAVHVAGLTRAGDEPGVAEAADRFVRQLHELDPRVGIFSQELIAPAQVPAIRELVGLLADREVHVVLTVRDPARTLASSWQQAVQQRQVKPLDVFLDEIATGAPDSWWWQQAQAVPDLVRRWGEVVPPERIHVVVVPPPSADRALLLQRFCGVVGLDPTSLVVPDRHGNPALGTVQAELLRRVNVALGDRLPHVREGYREVGKQWLAMRVLRRQAMDRPRLPERVRPVVEGFSDDWITFLRGAGVDVVGDLEELRVDGRVFAPDAELATDDSVLLDAAVEALADILELRHDERHEQRRRGPAARPAAPASGSGVRAALRRRAPAWVRRTTRRWRHGRG